VLGNIKVSECQQVVRERALEGGKMRAVRTNFGLKRIQSRKCVGLASSYNSVQSLRRTAFSLIGVGEVAVRTLPKLRRNLGLIHLALLYRSSKLWRHAVLVYFDLFWSLLQDMRLS